MFEFSELYLAFFKIHKHAMFDYWNGEREMSMVLTYDLDLLLMQVALISFL